MKKKQDKTEKKFSMLVVVWKAFKITWSFSKKPMFGLFFVAAISSFLPLTQTKLLGDLVNKFGTSIEGGSFPVLLISLYASVWALVRILGSLRDHLDQIWAISVSNGLELMRMKQGARLDLAKHDDPDFQDLVQRAGHRGIWPVINVVDRGLRQFSDLIVLIIASIAAIANNWVAFLVIVITLIPTLIVQIKQGKSIYSIWMINSPTQRAFAHLRGHLSHRFSLQQNKTLQATGNLLKRANNILNKFKKDQFKYHKSRLVQNALASLLAGIGFGIALVLIINDVIAGKILLGDMVFLVGALGYFVSSLNSIFSSISNQYEEALIAADIFAILEEIPVIIKPEKEVRLKLEDAPEIEFRDVWFQYPNTKKWVLKDINLVIKPGEKVALVGENGAGKTTLIKLLSRVYDPTKGQILINGIDLTHIDPEKWLRYLAILFQQFSPFSFTAEESIAMGRAEEAVNSLKVQQAARLASAHDFIGAWDNGYKQQLGREFHGGIDPSRGQEQKIAIARTIYRDGMVVIFDEPTSSVDALSEARIFRDIEKVIGGKTLFLISHRFNTVRSVDRILVLDNCKIIEDGSHEELLMKKGLYAQMFNEQAKSYMEVSK